MAKLIECIPNFSCSKEKDEATYNALVETAKSVPGCTCLTPRPTATTTAASSPSSALPRPSRRSPSS